MKIAIHNSKIGFHPRWISYCIKENVPYKIVDCYANDIIEQIKECDVLLWHYNHLNEKDNIFAKQLLFSLEQSSKIVFPEFNDGWHFDDKVGQKYLLEAIDAPHVPSYVFYTKQEALQWMVNTSFPKVFKLRGGAGSVNVKLIHTKKEAKKIIHKAFKNGFSYYDALGSLKERFRKYRDKKTDFKDVLKGFLRLFKEPEFSRFKGKEIGYVYFQDFIPNNTFDIRVIVIGDKAFGLKRFVRKDDFRASGSGKMSFEKADIDEQCVEISFTIMKKLNAACLAFDFVFDKDNNPLIIEVSYGFAVDAYDSCPGYWNENLNWFQGHFNPQEWMVENALKQLKRIKLKK